VRAQGDAAERELKSDERVTGFNKITGGCQHGTERNKAAMLLAASIGTSMTMMREATPCRGHFP